METEKLQMKGIGCLQGKNLEAFRNDALKDFEDLSPRTLRRHREPYYSCILKELEEDGYEKTPQFIRELMDENEEVILADDLGITPRISESPMYLDLLRELLIRAEEAGRRRDTVSESIEISRGALRLLDFALGRCANAPPSPLVKGKRGKGWLWLVRRLLLAALGLAQATRIDGGLREATCRFIYGRFLLEHYPDNDTKTASEHLIMARRMSKGMIKWRFGEENGDTDQTLFGVICLQLRDMYLKITEELRPHDPQGAMRACHLALRRAQDAGQDDKYAEALTQVGHCNITLGKLETALENFNEVLEIRQRAADISGTCEALINVAIALQKLRKIDEAKDYLEQILSVAERGELSTWEAHAFWRLGELLVRGRRPAEGSTLIMLAYGRFAGGTQCRKAATGTARPSVYVKIEKQKIPALRTRRETIRVNAQELEYRILHGTQTVGFLINPVEKKNMEMEQYPEVRRKLTDTPRKMSTVSLPVDQSDMRSSEVSQTSTIYLSRRSRRSRRKTMKEATYFLDDHDDEDLAMTTALNNTFKEELSHTRCMFGVAKGQEMIEVYFSELLKANTNTDSRVRIIDWKLNKKPFWEFPTLKSEENVVEVSEVVESQDLGDMEDQETEYQPSSMVVINEEESVETVNVVD